MRCCQAQNRDLQIIVTVYHSLNVVIQIWIWTSYGIKFGMDLKRVTSPFQQCVNIQTWLSRSLLTLCTNITWTVTELS